MSSPAVAHAPGTPVSQALLYVGSLSGHVYALSADGTHLAWPRDPVQVPGSTSQSGPVATAGNVYIGTGKHLDCLDAGSGRECWQPPFTAASRVVSVPVVGNGVGTIYFGTLGGGVYAVTPAGRLVHVR